MIAQTNLCYFGVYKQFVIVAQKHSYFCVDMYEKWSFDLVLLLRINLPNILYNVLVTIMASKILYGDPFYKYIAKDLSIQCYVPTCKQRYLNIGLRSTSSLNLLTPNKGHLRIKLHIGEFKTHPCIINTPN